MQTKNLIELAGCTPQGIGRSRQRDQEAETDSPMNLLSVTQTLKTHSDFSRVPDNVLFAACQRGDRVHAYCAAKAKDIYHPPVPEYIQGYCESFDRWFELVEEVLLVEEEIVDPNMGFFGHPNLVVRLKGHKNPAVVDIKTPLTRNKLWAVQISSYVHLVRQYLNCEIEHSGAIRLRSDGAVARFDEVNNPDRWFGLFLNELNFQRGIAADW